jgi:hypothetical protein
VNGDGPIAEGVQLFLERLEQKTSWGKNEVKDLLLKSIVEAGARGTAKRVIGGRGAQGWGQS